MFHVLLYDSRLSKFHESIFIYFSDSCTLLICPGICNSSEKKYIRTFVQHAVDRGYRAIVLNHVGSLSSVKLTSPKIFTYGMSNCEVA